MTILSIAQDAADEMSIPRPTTLVSSSDQTARALLRYITEAARALARDYDWQVLTREKTHTTLASETQTNAIESDFLRFVPDSFFNRTKTWRVTGPLTPEEWQAHKASLTTRIGDAFRVRGSAILIAPTPAAGETLAYEYITKNIGTDTTGATARTAWSADTDLPYLSEELLTLEVIWRFKHGKGLDYAEDHRKAQTCAADLIKQDGGRRRLDMGGQSVRMPVPPRVPETLVGLS